MRVIIFALATSAIGSAYLCMPLGADGSNGDQTQASSNTSSLRLRGDAAARQQLQEDLALKPPESASVETRADWYYEIGRDSVRARDYAAAAEYYHAGCELLPNDWTFHAARSIALGKAGRYKEAEAEALKALELAGPEAMHPSMELAKWEWHLGKREQALSRIRKVAVPRDFKERRLYYACLACFNASVGDEGQIEAAMRDAIELDAKGNSLIFFRRDIAFDPYRKKSWFIKLVGETLSE